MLAAMRRCGSLVEFSLMTVNATWPGLMCFNPSLRAINLQFGGEIEETRTMLQAAMPALRSASSQLESRQRCFPRRLGSEIFLATDASGDRARREFTRRWRVAGVFRGACRAKGPFRGRQR